MNNINTTSMEDLFKEAFGLNSEDMEVNKPYLVEEANIGIESIDEEGNRIFSKIIRAVKKSKRKMFKITLGDGKIIRVSKDHVFAIKRDNDENILWVSTQDIYNLRKSHDFYFMGDFDFIKLKKIVTDGSDFPLDIEVDNTHCYFSNGILSHNSLYGPDYSVSAGGYAAKYYSSWIARVTRVEDIVDHGEVIGIKMKVKNSKNKLKNPRREATLDLYYNSGIKVDDEYLDYLKLLGIIEQRGAWFYNEEWGMKVAGKNGVAEFLHNNPELYERVKKQVNDMICGHTILDNEEQSEEDAFNEYSEEYIEENNDPS